VVVAEIMFATKLKKAGLLKSGTAFKKLLIFLSLLIVLFPFNLYGKTLILEGSLNSKIKVTQQMRFDVPEPLENLSFRFALPKDFSNKFVSQSIQNLDIKIEPEPEKFEKITDQYGNHWAVANWRNLTKSVKITVTFEASVGSELRAETSVADYI